MARERFSRRVEVPVPVDELFRWHERPGAFERLSPPWDGVKVLGRTGGIRSGDRVTISAPLGPLPLCSEWEIEHRDYVENRQFKDVLLKGPFPYWEHTHRFCEADGGRSVLEDEIEYELPFGALGGTLGRGLVRSTLERVFRYRHQVLLNDLSEHRGVPPLRFAVTGSGGLVGSALVPFLTTGGHEVVRIVRTKAVREGQLFWSPERGALDGSPLSGFDAVIHLAGEPIVSGLWTKEKREEISRSRREGTRTLSDAILKLEAPPKCVVSASAIGFYGSRGEELLDERSAPGTGFLSEVTRDWEEASAPLREAGVRVVNLRIGIVLSPRGGALRPMLPPFRAGLGGPIGDGGQYMSWISLDDLVRTIYFAAREPSLAGPVNAVAPHPVTNTEFTKTLGAVLNRPAFLRVPAIALRKTLGDLAGETLLASQRVRPGVLEGRGFRFLHPGLEGALRFCLGG